MTNIVPLSYTIILNAYFSEDCRILTLKLFDPRHKEKSTYEIKAKDGYRFTGPKDDSHRLWNITCTVSNGHVIFDQYSEGTNSDGIFYIQLDIYSIPFNEHRAERIYLEKAPENLVTVTLKEELK